MERWNYTLVDSALAVRRGRRTVLGGVTAVITSPGLPLESPPPGKPTAAGAPFGRDLFIEAVPAANDDEVALLRARYCGRSLDGAAGVQLRIADWPGFDRALVCRRDNPFWTRPAWLNGPGEMPEQTQFLLIRRKGKAPRFLAVLPLTDGGMRSQLHSIDGQAALVSASGDSRHVPCGFVMAAVAEGDDPYALTERLFAAALAAIGVGRPRKDKPVPAFVDDFGWCSWNAFGQKVTERGVIAALKSFAKGRLPVGFYILDDGWQQTAGYEAVGDDGQPRRHAGLTGFDADGEKFPAGLAGLIRRVKQATGLRHFGVWHALQGYWGGLAPDGEPYKHYETFRDCLGRAIVKPAESYRFFHDYHAHLRDCGVDFVKVDNQSRLEENVRQRYPVGSAARTVRQALEGSAAVHFGGQMINCMGMSGDMLLQLAASNVARSSDDFYPNRPNNPGRHLVDNAYNNLWAAQLAVCDWDMFESHHPYAEMHAMARAISGSPVYCTDTPGRQDFALLGKLILADGRTLRCPEPAQVTADCLMVDPLNEPVLLKLFNCLDGGHALLGVFNCRATPELDAEGDTPVVFTSAQRQALAATATLGPGDVPALAEGNYAIYSHRTGLLTLMKSDDRAEITLEKFAADLLVLAPVEHGLGMLGLLDKFNSPAAVEQWGFDQRTLVAALVAGGAVGLYARRKPHVRLDGKAVPAAKVTYDAKTHLATVQAPPDRPVVIEAWL